MAYKDTREFLALLENEGLLKRSDMQIDVG